LRHSQKSTFSACACLLVAVVGGKWIPTREVSGQMSITGQMSVGDYDPELAYNLYRTVAFHRKLAEAPRPPPSSPWRHATGTFPAVRRFSIVRIRFPIVAVGQSCRDYLERSAVDGALGLDFWNSSRIGVSAMEAASRPLLPITRRHHS
jgi:hypothetical protein